MRLNRHGSELGKCCLGIFGTERPVVASCGIQACGGQRAAGHAGEASIVLHAVVVHPLLNQCFAEPPEVVCGESIGDLVRTGDRNPIQRWPDRATRPASSSGRIQR